MISVPDAGLFPITPRPVRFMNGSITSNGKPCGYVGNDVAVTTPISSPWPAVVSLPFERATRRPPTPGAARGGRPPGRRPAVPGPERLEVGQVEPPDGTGHIAERVGAFVPVQRSVRQRSRTDGVQHDHAGARHAAILRRAWSPPSASLASSSSSPA